MNCRITDLRILFPQPQAAEIRSQLCSDEELKYLFKKMESSFTRSKVRNARGLLVIYGTI